MMINYDRCPLCESKRLFAIIDLRWRQCVDCDHVFTHEYMDIDELKQIINNKDVDLLNNIQHQRHVWGPVVERIHGYVSPPNTWIDVGCGVGRLVAVASEFGYDVLGIDIREKYIAGLKQHGYNAMLGEIKDYKNNLVSIISMCDVLEHLPFPKQTLETANLIMIDGGILMISTPNMDSLPWVMYDYKGTNPYWQEVEHFHNFTRTRLYSLLRTCGFEPVMFAINSRFRFGMDIIARRI